MRPLRFRSLFLVAISLVSCRFEDSASDAAASACVSGQSVACGGPLGCHGFQACRADNSGFDACVCGNSENHSTNVTQANGGATYVGAVGGRETGVAQGSGGAFNTGLGGAGGIAGGSTLANGSSECAPKDMAGHIYPAYKPARRFIASCTETDVQGYYSECYVKGNCAEFKAGGSKSRCGECLAPTTLDAAAYGPILRLGTAASPMDETNMAGCIELMGEGECAKRLMVAALCEYDSCAESCPANDAATVQSLMSCMMSARSSTCTAAESAAVCITDSAHVAACSASGFEGQFLAIARVFCVQSH